MSKDGTMRDGRRARSGERPQPLVDKISAGKKTKWMEVDNFPDIDLLVGDDIGEGVELKGIISQNLASIYPPNKKMARHLVRMRFIVMYLIGYMIEGATNSLPHEWSKAMLKILLVSYNVKPH